MVSNRRKFLANSIAGFGLLAGASRLLGQAFDHAIIGSYTSIPGYGLDQAIELIRQLGFQTIEMHPMGVAEPRPGLSPGFQFDRLSEEERRKIKSAVAGFRHVSTHLPFADLTGTSPLSKFGTIHSMPGPGMGNLASGAGGRL